MRITSNAFLLTLIYLSVTLHPIYSGATAPTASTTSNPATPASEAATADTSGFVPSNENVTTSIMFTPDELTRYLKILRAAEKKISRNPNPVELVVPDVIADTLLSEEEPVPIVFPYYHLRTILFSNQNQWMIRINGITITSSNNKPENELFVTAINPYRASFIWRPQDKRLIPEFDRIRKMPLNEVRPTFLEHRRIIRTIGAPALFLQDGYLTFTLENNQLFYTELMTIYEGRPQDILQPVASLPVSASLDEEEEDPAAEVATGATTVNADNVADTNQPLTATMPAMGASSGTATPAIMPTVEPDVSTIQPQLVPNPVTVTIPNGQQAPSASPAVTMPVEQAPDLTNTPLPVIPDQNAGASENDNQDMLTPEEEFPELTYSEENDPLAKGVLPNGQPLLSLDDLPKDASSQQTEGDIEPLSTSTPDAAAPEAPQ